VDFSDYSTYPEWSITTKESDKQKYLFFSGTFPAFLFLASVRLHDS
jgi:hypothetical protein